MRRVLVVLVVAVTACADSAATTTTSATVPTTTLPAATTTPTTAPPATTTPAASTTPPSTTTTTTLAATTTTTPPLVTVLVYFLNQPNFAIGVDPYVTPVERAVPPPAVARHALEALFAGPTPGEAAQGLAFVASEATGFGALTISDGIARVRLLGSCNSSGSTFTIANEIVPTLKQFASVDHVKIFDPAGHTAEPEGPVDSIPGCLEP